MNLLGKPKLMILDLLTGDARVVDKLPFVIGASTGADWMISAGHNGVANEAHFSTSGTPSGYALTPHYQSDEPILVDGAFLDAPIALPPNRGSMLKIHGHLFGLCSTKEPEKFLQQVNLGQWSVFNGSTNITVGTVAFSDVPAIISSSGSTFEDCAVSLPTLGAPGIWLKDLPDIVPPPAPPVEVSAEHEPGPEPVREAEPLPETPKAEEIPSNEGEFQCPICWLHFEGKHTKHIASHAQLLGDSLLGKAEYRRFIPTKWDSSGNALDDFGLTSPDTACPHCHERLPAGFGEFQQHIFSIVGAPTSGKSYYLAILLKSLRRHLFHKFEISFMDQDPEYNIELNDIIHKLFSARRASDGRIQKTQMKGSNYKQVVRGGQEVDLPKPYMFNISRTNVDNTDSCLVFYDNAGEHFLPTHSRAEDFHILHVAKASVLFFLYDPLVNIDIKHALIKVESDQLEQESVPDMQATILSQMNVKISRALGKPTAKKLDTPLAVVVGKCDVWHSLVPDWEKVRDPTGKGQVLNLDIVDDNSAIIRKFLNEFAPEIVASVERMSRTVRYFPISAFGHKPKAHPYLDSEGKNVSDVAPEAAKIKPFLIEIPTDWAISQTIPDLIPEMRS